MSQSERTNRCPFPVARLSTLTGRLLLGILTLGPLGCHKPTVDQHVANGDASVAAGRLAEAIIEYRLGLQADPRRGDVRLKLADTYAAVQNVPSAISEFLRAADQLPDRADAQIKAGNIFLRAGDFERARTLAAKALLREPKSVAAQILLRTALAGLKDLDGAIEGYQEAIALDPTAGNAYVNTGSIQLMQGRRPEAEAAFRKAVEAAPASVTARMALANFLWATGRMAEAEAALKNAVTLAPSDLAANQALGIFYVVSNRGAQAEPYFRVVAAQAKTTAAIISLADYYGFARKFDEARTLLTQLASSKPDAYPQAMTRLAALEAAQGRWQQASTAVNEVLGKFPGNAPARLLNARLLLREGRREEAMAQANLVLSADPDPGSAADAYLIVGSVQASLSRRDEAINAYKETLTRKSRSLKATMALATLHLANGAPEKAETYARMALALDPANAAARGQLVRVLVAEKNGPAARAELATLQRALPNSPLVLNLLAAEQMSRGARDRARALYEQVLRIAPSDLEASTGLAELDITRGRATDAVNRNTEKLGTAAQRPEFLMLGAQTSLAAGDPARAEDLLTQAIALDPSLLRAYAILGGLYLGTHRLDDARRSFQQMADRNNRSVPAQTMLGILLEIERRFPEAEEQYRKVLAIDAKAGVAANNLACLYLTAGRRRDEALALARTALEKMPDEPRVLDTVGWAYYKMDMPEPAIRFLESSAAREPGEPAIRYHLGMVYAERGLFKKARVELRAALASKVEFDGAAEARARLSGIE